MSSLHSEAQHVVRKQCSVMNSTEPHRIFLDMVSEIVYLKHTFRSGRVGALHFFLRRSASDSGPVE